MLINRMVSLIALAISVSALYSTSLLADPPENKGKPDKANKADSSFDAGLSVMVNAGTDLLLVSVGTQIISDVFNGVFD